MTAGRNLTEQDYELLSAYIDGVLTDSERSALDIRLQDDLELRRELATLQQTVSLIKQMSSLQAPRDFRLDANMVEVKPQRWLVIFPTTAAFSALSAVAAMLLLIVGGVLLFAQSGMSASAPMLMQDTTGAVAVAATSVLQSSTILTETSPSIAATGDSDLALTSVAVEPAQDEGLTASTIPGEARQQPTETNLILPATALATDAELSTFAQEAQEQVDDATLEEAQDEAEATEPQADTLLMPEVSEDSSAQMQYAPVPANTTLESYAAESPPNDGMGGGSLPDGTDFAGSDLEMQSSAAEGEIPAPAVANIPTLPTEPREREMTAEGDTSQAELTFAPTALPAATLTPLPTSTVTASATPTSAATLVAAVPTRTFGTFSQPSANDEALLPVVIIFAGFGLMVIALGTTLARRRS